MNTFFPAYRQWWFFAFASDKWQVTPKLTFTVCRAGHNAVDIVLANGGRVRRTLPERELLKP